MPDIPAPLATAVADRYRVERELGQGGMATVYLAEDLRHRRNVALKVLRPELAATLGPARFLREIEVAARLQHPHILPVHDSGEARGFLYSGVMADGSYRIFVVPASGGTAREVAHSEGPTYQNFRFSFDLRGDTLHLVLADRQGDVWMSEVTER